MRERGIDAWGIENNRAIHGKTPKALKKYNKLGSITDMPFKAGSFDFVFETSLCHLSDKQAARAVREFNRVVTIGGRVRLGDLGHVAGADRPLRPVARGEEARHLVGMVRIVLRQRLRPVDAPPRCMDAVWAATLAANKGPGQWYVDADSLRYSFFDKVADEDE